MTDTVDGVPSRIEKGSPMRRDVRRQFQRNFRLQAVQSYLYLSIGMGIVAGALPILLVIFGGYDEHFSISHYYHSTDNARNILVGSLWATGTFLFLFQGLSDRENWILNIAGVAAVSVAMNPVAEKQCSGSDFGVHQASAIVFFACLAIVAVVFSRGRIGNILALSKKRFFTTAYTATGVAMIGMPVAIAAIQVLSRATCESHWIFWIESFGIWSFAAYWFVKTYEYRLLLRVG